MEILWVKILIFVLCTASVFLMIVSVPGNFIASAVALAYLIFTDGIITGWNFGIILALALLGELLENILSIFGAKKVGASKKGMMGAFLGGIFGAIIGSAIFPVVGTILGVFAGAFILTFLIEWRVEKNSPDSSAKIGLGAMIGKILSVAIKYSFGLIILVIIALRFFVRS